MRIVLMALGVAASVAALTAQTPASPQTLTVPANSKAVISGPTGPSPYDIIRGWHKPFAALGFAFGGNSGVFAESPNRIFVAQRGEFKLPDPVPPDFLGFAGSIKMNVPNLTDRRVWKNCLYTLDANGKVRELWTQWDKLSKDRAVPAHIVCASAPTTRSAASGSSTRLST